MVCLFGRLGLDSGNGGGERRTGVFAEETTGVV